MLGYARAGRFDYFVYALWVRWNRLDFTPVSLETLGLSPGHSEHHTASGGVFLADVLKRIQISPGSRVVDIGCGKGSALCTFADFPFDEIAGVELSEALANAARVNAATLRFRVTLFVCDATDFRDLDRFTHVYMFNPFPAAVMRHVVANLVDSVRRRPRPLTIIYFFPVCHDVIMASGLFASETAVDVQFTHPYHLYVHDGQTPDVGGGPRTGRVPRTSAGQQAIAKR